MTRALRLLSLSFIVILTAAPFFISTSLIFVSSAVASEMHDIYDVPKVTALAHKKYRLKNELTPQICYLASDPFVKYAALGLTYTRLFSDVVAWEVFNANYAFAFDAGLKTDLIDNWGVNPALIDSIQYYATSNLVLSPIYTKNLLFNSSIVYSEFSAVAGGGVSNYKYGGLEPVLDFGLILRYFLNSKESLKFDFRDYLFPTAFTQNNITITVGYALSLGGTR